MSDESPNQFNQEPDAGTQALIAGVIMETLMSINWKDFLTHLGTQVVVAAGTAVVTSLAGADYSSLGVIAPAIQGVTALLTTAWNTYESKIAL